MPYQRIQTVYFFSEVKFTYHVCPACLACRESFHHLRSMVHHCSASVWCCMTCLSQDNKILLGFSISVLCVAVCTGGLGWLAKRAKAVEQENEGKLTPEEESAVRAGGGEAACYVTSSTIINPDRLRATRPGGMHTWGEKILYIPCMAGLVSSPTAVVSIVGMTILDTLVRGRHGSLLSSPQYL